MEEFSDAPPRTKLPFAALYQELFDHLQDDHDISIDTVNGKNRVTFADLKAAHDHLHGASET